jgi:hypothetical protein
MNSGASTLVEMAPETAREWPSPVTALTFGGVVDIVRADVVDWSKVS